MLKKTTSLYENGTKHFLSSIPNILCVYRQKQTLYSPPPNISILEALCSDGNLRVALFEMGKQGVEMVFKDYNNLLNECIKQRAIREGQRVHAHMIKTLYRPPIFLRTRLIVFYVKCELLGDARWVFDEMPERNVVTWTAMISAHAQRGNFFEALNLFVQMLRSGTEPNEFTFATVLTSCMGTFGLQFGRQIQSLLIKSPFESHMYVGSSLLDMYAKAGRIHEARLVFEGLPERDVVSFTAIISGCAQQGLYEDAIEIFRKLQGEGMFSNYVTYTSLLNALSGLAAIEHGRQVHSHVIRTQLPFYVILQNSLIDMYSKCGNFTYSRRIFDSMSERTVSTWNAMLVGYSKHGMGREAVDLFGKMREENETRPDNITFLAVLSGCSHGGMEEKGLKIFNEMVTGENKVALGMEHYGCVVDLLGRSGQVERAYQFIQQMPFEPSASILGSLLGACRFHLNVDIGEIIGNRLLEIEPEYAGNYVILSNIYASAGRWADARRVRKLMKEKSVVKEPGKSWVELNKTLHTFYSSDQSHPRQEEVSQMVSKMSTRIKEAGYTPDLSFVPYDVDEEQKEKMLLGHSEKLALAFGLITTSAEKPIRVIKNLRICIDCHNFAKFVSQVYKRQISLRDKTRFHHISGGVCSCGDYW